MIKAIVLDIDGTLLNDQRIVSPKTKQALIDIQTKGIKVILASGRPTPGIIPLAKELELDKNHGFIVSYNGAVITDIQTNKTIFEQAIDQEGMKSILNHVKKFEVLPMIYEDEHTIVENAYYQVAWDKISSDQHIVKYESHGCNMLVHETKDIVEYVKKDSYKIMVMGEPNYLQNNHHKIAEPFIGKYNSMFTGDAYYEFTDLGVDKAHALRQILPSYQIEAENIIAFGDGENDKTMIQYAGVGVAMGNAIDEVKSVANFITKDNNEDGIVHALSIYLK